MGHPPNPNPNIPTTNSISNPMHHSMLQQPRTSSPPIIPLNNISRGVTGTAGGGGSNNNLLNNSVDSSSRSALITTSTAGTPLHHATTAQTSQPSANHVGGMAARAVSLIKGVVTSSPSDPVAKYPAPTSGGGGGAAAAYVLPVDSSEYHELSDNNYFCIGAPASGIGMTSSTAVTFSTNKSNADSGHYTTTSSANATNISLRGSSIQTAI